jgi:chaperonin cofactor prefoldin
MGKNSQLHLFLETELLDELRKQSERLNLSVSEVCRQKIRQSDRLDKIEFILEMILRRLDKNEN